MKWQPGAVSFVHQGSKSQLCDDCMSAHPVDISTGYGGCRMSRGKGKKERKKDQELKLFGGTLILAGFSPISHILIDWSLKALFNPCSVLQVC